MGRGQGWMGGWNQDTGAHAAPSCSMCLRADGLVVFDITHGREGPERNGAGFPYGACQGVRSLRGALNQLTGSLSVQTRLNKVDGVGEYWASMAITASETRQ